jgi:hypothetical protein
MEVTKKMNALPDSVSSNLPLLALPDLTEEGLEMLCTNVVQEQPRLPDGRLLLFKEQGASLPRLDAQERAVV